MFISYQQPKSFLIRRWCLFIRYRISIRYNTVALLYIIIAFLSAIRDTIKIDLATLKFVNNGTDRARQTMQTHIRLQSYQNLHCLPFLLYPSDTLSHYTLNQIVSFFRIITEFIIFGDNNFQKFGGSTSQTFKCNSCLYMYETSYCSYWQAMYNSVVLTKDTIVIGHLPMNGDQDEGYRKYTKFID